MADAPSADPVDPVDPVAWLAGLSPWPVDGFGLERMRSLLAALGDPQLRYPAVHVVGTNGKSTATVTIEQLLLSEGLSVGATVSPHVRSWDERIRLDGRQADLPAALRRVRADAGRLGATQFETITAAALTAFADAGIANRVVREGLQRGLILLQSGVDGTSITIAPPLTIDDDQLERAIALLDQTIEETP